MHSVHRLSQYHPGFEKPQPTSHDLQAQATLSLLRVYLTRGSTYARCQLGMPTRVGKVRMLSIYRPRRVQNQSNPLLNLRLSNIQPFLQFRNASLELSRLLLSHPSTSPPRLSILSNASRRLRDQSRARSHRFPPDLEGRRP